MSSIQCIKEATLGAIVDNSVNILIKGGHSLDPKSFTRPSTGEVKHSKKEKDGNNNNNHDDDEDDDDNESDISVEELITAANDANLKAEHVLCSLKLKTDDLLLAIKQSQLEREANHKQSNKWK